MNEVRRRVMAGTADIFDGLRHHLIKQAEFALPGLAGAAGLATAQLVVVGKAVLNPSIFTVFVVLHLADLAIGTYKAKITDKMNSDSGYRGFLKVVISLFAISMILYISQAAPWIASLVQFLLIVPILSEVYSLFENLSDIEDAHGVNTGWIKGTLRKLGALKAQYLDAGNNEGGPDA